MLCSSTKNRCYPIGGSEKLAQAPHMKELGDLKNPEGDKLRFTL
jgi:hypothetical protein